MKKLILIVLFLGTVKAYAQYPIITDSEKKPGIYRNYEEFKNNKPSLKLDYQIISKQIDFSEVSSIKVYSLDIPKEESREIGDVFGFCDGKQIFMVSSEEDVLHKFVFYKVEYLLKYAVFDAMASNIEFTMTGQGGAMEMGGINQSKKTMIVDFETGIITTLTKGKLKEILSDKPQLLEKFKKQDNKNDYLKKYLIDYLKS